jgi:hypothetical protein
MPSLFPGMDPYLESQGYWPDFHMALLIDCRRALRHVLPRHYGAFVEERINLVDLSGELSRHYRPDVAVIRKGRDLPPTGDRGVPATLEPITIPLTLEDLDEVHERWIEIRRFPDQSLVTVIEILSPTKKIGSGRIEYVEKRNQWIRQPVNLVEIDLLLRGHRMPMGRSLPPWDYFAFVARSSRRPDCDVYAWSVRRPLPTIPIPLAEPDPDASLDLRKVFAQTYDDAPYADSIDYTAPLELPLTPEDRAWAEELARAESERPSRES